MTSTLQTHSYTPDAKLQHNLVWKGSKMAEYSSCYRWHAVLSEERKVKVYDTEKQKIVLHKTASNPQHRTVWERLQQQNSELSLTLSLSLWHFLYPLFPSFLLSFFRHEVLSCLLLSSLYSFSYFPSLFVSLFLFINMESGMCHWKICRLAVFNYNQLNWLID